MCHLGVGAHDLSCHWPWQSPANLAPVVGNHRYNFANGASQEELRSMLYAIWLERSTTNDTQVR